MNKNQKNWTAVVWVILGAAARLVPHPANVSPLTGMGVFGGSNLGRKTALAMTLVSLLLSDIALSYVEGHSIFGAWSFFTYTGFAAIVLAGSFMGQTNNYFKIGSYIAGSSLFFWIWTNFGFWAMGEMGMYPRTVGGLVECYVAALPFLRNAMLGDLAWGLGLFLSFQGVKKFAPRTSLVKA